MKQAFQSCRERRPPNLPVNVDGGQNRPASSFRKWPRSARGLTVEDFVTAAVLPSDEAATYLGITRSTLEKKRVFGTGPVYLRLGRTVRYRQRDLDAWLDGKAVRSTSDRAA